MTRIIARETDFEESFTSLARIEDVADSREELFKKYMSEAKDKGVLGKSVEETAFEDEQRTALDMISFLGLEDEVTFSTEDDGLAMLSQMFTEANEEELERLTNDPEYIQKVKELNEKEGVFEVDLDQNWVDEDDPHLAKLFQKESQKITATLTARRERKRLDHNSDISDWEAAMETEAHARNASNEPKQSGYGFSQPAGASSNHNTGTRAAAATETTSTRTNKETKFDEEYEKRAEVRGKYTNKMYGQMMDIVYTGTLKKKKQKKHTAFSRHERFSVKKLWNKFRDWTKSDESALYAKMGALIALQTAMAMTTKNLKFDSAMQAVTFLGMGLAVFGIGREIRAEGFDARRMNLINI